jgi:hypothetical protein
VSLIVLGFGDLVWVHRVGEVVAAVDVAVEADDALMLAEDVAGDVVEEVADVAVGFVCDVAACVWVVVAETRVGDVELEAADGVLAAGLTGACGAVVVDVSSAGVEVEETSGGAFLRYVPEG